MCFIWMVNDKQTQSSADVGSWKIYIYIYNKIQSGWTIV